MISNPVKSATNMAILQFLIHNGARTREITANKLAHVFWFILAQHKSEMADSTNQYFAIMRTLRNLLREITKVAKGPRILNHKIWFKFLIFFFSFWFDFSKFAEKVSTRTFSWSFPRL